MRHLTLALGMISLLILGVNSPSPAADVAPVPAAKPTLVTITTSAADYEIRDYRVDVSIKGNMPNPDTKQPMDFDTAMTLKIRHKYNKREGDGLLPMDVSLLEGTVDMAGQQLSITPSIYPKLTVLLDKNFRIDDIFGAGASAPGALPGLNYSNMTMLYYIPGPARPRPIGDTWETKVTIPALREAYTVKNTMKATGIDGNARTATVRQEITRVPMPKDTKPVPAMKAIAESTFTMDTGKLLKSHVDCDVSTGVAPAKPSATEKDKKPRQEPAPSRANIKIDISLVK